MTCRVSRIADEGSVPDPRVDWGGEGNGTLCCARVIDEELGERVEEVQLL